MALRTVADEMRHHFGYRIMVFDPDPIASVVRQPVEQNERHGLVPQVLEGAAARAAGRCEDNSVDPAVVQLRHHPRLDLRIVMRVGQEDNHAELRAFGLDGVYQVVEVPVGARRDRETDRIGGRPGQGARECIGGVADGHHGIAHSPGRFGADEPRAIENMRDGRCRDTRMPCNIDDRCHQPVLVNTEPRPRSGATALFGRTLP